MPGWVKFLAGNTPQCARSVTCPNSTVSWHKSVFIWDPFRPFHLHLFYWLVLICIIFCYKTVIVSIVLFWVLWVILTNWITKWGSENLKICTHLVRSVSGLGISKLVCCVWNKDSLVDPLSLICEDWPTTRVLFFSLSLFWTMILWWFNNQIYPVNRKYSTSKTWESVWKGCPLSSKSLNTFSRL